MPLKLFSDPPTIQVAFDEEGYGISPVVFDRDLSDLEWGPVDFMLTSFPGAPASTRAKRVGTSGGQFASPSVEVVLGTGLEPARLSATASKTVVYANSTTRAVDRKPPELTICYLRLPRELRQFNNENCRQPVKMKRILQSR